VASQDGIPSVPGAADSGGRRHFVNHLHLTLSLSDIHIELALLGSRLQQAPVWYFATTPDHLLTMQRGFAAAIESYQARYGKIRALQVDPAMVRFADGYTRG